MAATATADDEILQVWTTFKKLNKDSLEYESLRNRLVERYMPLVRFNGPTGHIVRRLVML